MFFAPVAVMLRSNLAGLDDEYLTTHLTKTVFLGMTQFIGITFFLAEGFYCLVSHGGRYNIEAIDQQVRRRPARATSSPNMLHSHCQSF